MTQNTRELLVYDSPEPCPYISGRTARMPLRRPLEPLAPEEFDARLEQGDRRSGAYLYNTRCPRCRSCVPTRLAIDRFQPSSAQRRAWRKGHSLLRREVGPPRVDSTRVELFNKHRRLRGLCNDGREIDDFGYEHFLVQSCCQTYELRLWHEGQLVLVGICDQGQRFLSAVYTFYDPEFRGASLGVYSILSQVELCRERNLSHLYLGYYIAESPHMAYKALYRPQERLLDGTWQEV